MEFDFLSPVSAEVVTYAGQLSPQQLGAKVAFHTEMDFPAISKFSIILIGVPEYRGGNGVLEVDLSLFRKNLYQLYPGNWHAALADLGDVLPGNSLEDTYFALKKVAERLLKQACVPIIIGGTQDLTYPIYRAYDVQEQMVNLVSIDAQFDFGKQGEAISKDSYISSIIVEEPNNLFNYCNLGFQTYYNPQEEIDLMDKLYFEAYRLGELSANITLAEPVLRDADLVSLDVHAVQSAVSANYNPNRPNGFSGKEICALARYAGISDKVTSFGVFNASHEPEECALLAQIVWYFLEGFNYRASDYPFGTKTNYTRYIVPIDDQDTLIFYKSNKTDRWWIEANLNEGASNKYKSNTLLPCSYEEYLQACNQEIPERWWKIQRKMML